jgi:uncharacterized membrane-anchored protein
MKIATTLGETAGDLFAQTLKLGYFLTTVALFSIFVVTLIIQLRSRHYNPSFYWTVILTTGMAGTTISDFMNRDASARYLSKGATSRGWGAMPRHRLSDRRRHPDLAAPHDSPDGRPPA